MDKYKYQIIALVIAILIGIAGGSYFTSNKYEREITRLKDEKVNEIKQEIAKEVLKRVELDKRIIELESLHRADSGKIVTLEYSIKQDGVRTEQRRKDAKEFTNQEKRNFFSDRYNTKPN